MVADFESMPEVTPPRGAHPEGDTTESLLERLMAAVQAGARNSDLLLAAWKQLGTARQSLDAAERQKAWTLCVVRRALDGECCGLIDRGIHEADCVLVTLEREWAALARKGYAPQYRASLRQDGRYEIYLYSDDPAYKLAERYLEKHNLSTLSAGHVFVGRPEDYARFEAALAREKKP